MEPTQDLEPLTLLFTDIKDSVQLFDRLGDERARELTKEHDRTLCMRIEADGGHLVERVGDSIFGTFTDPAAAVRSAVSMQESIRGWWTGLGLGFDFGIRIGLHRGQAIVEPTHMAGATVNIAARILGQADAHEVVISDVLHAVLPPDLSSRFDWFGPFHPKGARGVVGLHRWNAPWKPGHATHFMGAVLGSTMTRDSDLRESDWVLDPRSDRYLVVGESPEVKGIRLAIASELRTVGRDPGCDYSLDPERVGMGIGRVHMGLIVSRRQLWVFDLGGKGGVILCYPGATGTFRVPQRAPLSEGTRLHTGQLFWNVEA